MIEALQTRFGLPGALQVIAGNNGLPKVRLTHASGASAEIYLHGAHVTSWRSASGDELFFVSKQSYFADDRPIRGGIPVIFPQFGGGVLPQHGLARVSDWSLSNTRIDKNGDIVTVLQLHNSSDTMALWPHAFDLKLTVTLSTEKLSIMMQAKNPATRPFVYHAVLHTYFAVGDIRRTTLEGLEGITFVDALRDDMREVETRQRISFAEEIDRIYVHAPDELHLHDEACGRKMTIIKRNMPDVVVWNPWVDKARRMVDFGDDEYPYMLCVETGNMDAQQVLLPGETWCGETLLFTSRE